MPNDAAYHPLVKFLHWSTVPLVVAQFGFAFAMSDGSQHRLPDRAGILHISTGVLILAVTLVRLACRIRFPLEVANSSAESWQQHCARATHLLIYGLLVALPLSGMLSAYLGTMFVADAHASAAVILLSLLAVHLLAASYHMFVRADGVVERMMPEWLNRVRDHKPTGSPRS
jgi:cytochrome b561